MPSGDWHDAALKAGAPPELVAFLQAAPIGHGLHECARGGNGEIGLGAAPDAYAALYIGRGGLSLALSPPEATALAAVSGLSSNAKTAATHYVRVQSDRLQDPHVHSLVTEAVGHAVDRSWHGPRWSRNGQTGPSGRLLPTCPLHHYELAANGWCMGCDDHAPAV